MVGSLLKGFRNLVLAIVLIITVYKTLSTYTIIAGAVCEVQLGITVDQTVR